MIPVVGAAGMECCGGSAGIIAAGWKPPVAPHVKRVPEAKPAHKLIRAADSRMDTGLTLADKLWLMTCRRLTALTLQ